MRLIAFAGLAGAGKSTAARYLSERHGFARRRFTAPIKAMLAALGVADADIEGPGKDAPHPLLAGHTPRQAMLALGAWGRREFGTDFWVATWARDAAAALSGGVPVVAEDCRLPNEAARVHALGGLVVRLGGRRSGAVVDAETERQDFAADWTIVNDGDREQLHRALDRLLDRHF